MKIRVLVLLAWAVNVAFVSGATVYGQQPSVHNRPNIVFIISDDHRWDALGAAGNPKIRTPVLDKLARDGVYFRQATIHVSQCAPSRAVLLTGLSPHQSGYYTNQSMHPDLEWADRFKVPTLPSLLQQAGYQTVLVGKWHVAPDPWNTGFSDIRTWLPQAAANYVDSRLAKGKSRKSEVVKGFTNGIFADDAVEFLSSPAAKEKPFFLWFASTIPHSPYQPNPPHIEHLYEGESPVSLHPPGFPHNASPDFSIPGDSGTASRETFVQYYQSVSYLDELVGRLLTALEKNSLSDNTIVVFLGDNGFMAGSRGITGKVVPYEESVRVPLIVRSPKLAMAKGASDVPASSLDIPATILALAGIGRPKNWGGRDLTPVLRGDMNHRIDHAIHEWADTEGQFRHWNHRLVRTPRHKLIRWRDPAKPDELYDLVADPHETKNLIGEPALRSTRNRLVRQLNDWMVRTLDPARFWRKMHDGRVPSRTELDRIEEEKRKSVEDKTLFKVDPKILDAYAGRYEFVTRVTVSIIKQGDKLFLQGDFGGRGELIPKSETRFVHKTLPVGFTFVRNEKGQVTHLIRRTARSVEEMTFDMRARKID